MTLSVVYEILEYSRCDKDARVIGKYLKLSIHAC